MPKAEPICSDSGSKTREIERLRADLATVTREREWLRVSADRANLERHEADARRLETVAACAQAEAEAQALREQLDAGLTRSWEDVYRIQTARIAELEAALQRALADRDENSRQVSDEHVALKRVTEERDAWIEAAGLAQPQYLADRLAALDALHDFARHPKADSLMRATLGPKMFSHLWGPELEALGHAVDLALGTAEKAEAQVRERQAALDLLTMRTATGQLCFRTANGIPMGMPKTTERKVEALLATKEPKR